MRIAVGSARGLGGHPAFAGFVFTTALVFGATGDRNGTDEQEEEQEFIHEQNLNGIVSQASLLQIGRQRGVMAGTFKSLKGQLLLDGGNLQGSFFQRTVVLVCQHDREGAFGLALNRKSGGAVGELIVADLPEALREEAVYLGGPVQPSALSYLHAEDALPDANVLPNLALGHSLDELVEIVSTPAEARKVRVFAGYSGWAPGQLDDEIKRGAWLTHPASIDWVFHTKPDQLWRRILLRKKDWRYRLLATGPENPAWN
jgi:putative transcriptional regulator